MRRMRRERADEACAQKRQRVSVVLSPPRPLAPSPSRALAPASLLAALSVLFAGFAQAEDVVYQRTAAKGAGPAKWSGTITDYTGRELRMQAAPNGKERVFPADQIVRIETAYTPEQLGADKLAAAGKLREALPQYMQALKAEKRSWVRRQILAQLVWCYRATGEWSFAVRMFQALVESDPQTQYFDAIPLTWTPLDVAAPLEREAIAWLDSQQSALDVLIGASLLSGTAARERAAQRLSELTAHKDPRIAWLAQGQLWRAIAVTASPEQVAAWDEALDKIPPALAAGPTYVVGNEWARRKQGDKAALRLMQLPILYPRERGLSARALATAGLALEGAQRKEEAAGLYREIIESYPEAKDAVADAQARLQAMAGR